MRLLAESGAVIPARLRVRRRGLETGEIRQATPARLADSATLSINSLGFIRVTDNVFLRLPLLAVTVSGYVPATVLVPTVTTGFDLSDPVTVDGVTAVVAPVGSPLTLNPTLPLNPFSAPTVTVSLDGDALRAPESPPAR